jgi:hypothetical protein
MALSGQRTTDRRGDYHFVGDAPVKANAIVYHGSLAAIDSTGYVIPGAASTTLYRPGRFNAGPMRTKIDATGLASGAKTGVIEYGTFLWKNSASTDAITVAERGDSCYIVDDETVAKTSGSSTRSVAGTIQDVTSDGVWVFMPKL